MVSSPGSGKEMVPTPGSFLNSQASKHLPDSSAASRLELEAFKTVPLPFLFSIKGSQDNHLKQLMSFRWASETGDQRDAQGKGSLAEFLGGWGETQREESLVANKLGPHTPSPGVRTDPRKKLGVLQSLLALCTALWCPLSPPVHGRQTCLVWLALHCRFELRLRKDLKVFCKGTKDFCRPRCHCSPANNAPLRLHFLRPCDLLDA